MTPGVVAGRAWYLDSLPLPRGVYVLVYVDPIEDCAVLHRVPPSRVDELPVASGPPLGLYQTSFEGLKAASETGEARDVELLRSHPRRPQAVPTAKFEKTALLMSTMLEPDILRRLAFTELRPSAVRALADAHGYRTKYVLRMLHRLLDCALNVRAAAESGHHRSGKRPNVQYAKKQGRPRRVAMDDPALAGRNVSAEDLELLRAYFDARSPQKATQKSYDDFKANFALKRVQALESGYVTTVSAPDHEAISIGQYRYHLTKLIDQQLLNAQVRDATRGDITRVLRGHAREGIQIPGQRLLIDSTLADVYLVCSWDRTRIIGRPVVYIVTDAATSAIVGLHVTLYAPSAKQAKIALFNALLPKGDYLRRFGLEAWESLFPRACLPTELYADRGELHSIAGRRLAADLPMILKFAPAYTPEWKAVVERSFRFLNQFTIHWLPGTTKGRLRERGEKDARLDAILTVTEFTKLLVARILQWNKVGKPELVLRPELIADRVEPGPATNFQWGLTHLHGSPRYLGLGAAVTQLLEGVDVGVTAKGITNDKLKWYGAWMNDPVLWHRRLMDRSFNLYENPWNAESAWAISAVDNLLRTVSLNNARPVDSSWALEDLHDSVEIQTQYRARHEIQSQHFGTAVDITCRDVVDGAKAATQDAHAVQKRSKRSRVANIAQNRQAELAPAPVAPHQLWNPVAADENTTFAPGYDDWITPL